MRLEDLDLLEVRSEAQRQATTAGVGEHAKLREKTAALSEILATLLFRATCFECNKMSAVPQGAFAAIKIRQNFERANPSNYQEEEEEPQKGSKNYGFNTKVLQESRELTPLKYNSKLMNSIWGLYNRYSVHNFKQIDADNTNLLAEAWGVIRPGAAAEVVVAEGRGPAARIIGATGATGH